MLDFFLYFLHKFSVLVGLGSRGFVDVLGKLHVHVVFVELGVFGQFLPERNLAVLNDRPFLALHPQDAQLLVYRFQFLLLSLVVGQFTGL